MSRRRARRAAAFLVATAALAGCGVPAVKIPAAGELGGARVATTVDSEIARHYLERSRAEPALDARIESIERRHAAGIPAREDLAAIARATSVDFAAIYFARRVLADACNREVARRFDRHLAAPDAPVPDADRYLVLFVPGWDYADNGWRTGADFARPRAIAARHGLRHGLAPLGPTDPIEDNARALAAEISRHARAGERILLASASSAGPTTLAALAEHLAPRERAAVAGWINIGGILHGSPLVEHLASGPRRPFFELGLLWKGWRRHAVMSLGATEGRARFARLRLDPAIPVVSYVSVPLSGQVGPYTEWNYPAIAREGPNDGLTLLADAVVPGSVILLSPGTDHFIAEDPRFETKSAALMRLMIEWAALEPARRCKPGG